MAASAPVIALASVKVDVSREDSTKSWDARGSVLSFFIGTGFRERNNFLLREVSDIVHADAGSGSGRL